MFESTKPSQMELQLTQRIRILELDNTDLRNKLTSCREQMDDLIVTPIAFDSQQHNRSQNVTLEIIGRQRAAIL
jgi:hypothetical protein